MEQKCMKIAISITIIFFLCLMQSGHLKAAEKNLRNYGKMNIETYKNNQYAFSFKYPSTWRKETPMSNTGVIKIVSQKGKGTESCNVNIRIVSDLKNSSTASVIKSLDNQNNKRLIDEYQNNGFTDISILERGITKLFNRDAFYITANYTIHTMGVDIPTTVITATTTRKDVVYNIACGSVEPERFSEAYPTFKFIIGSFFIDP